MATYKVGQRVRVARGNDYTARMGYLGKAGVIVAIPSQIKEQPERDCDVLLDGYPHSLAGCFWQFEPSDPKADEFLERVKGWGPLHEEPKVEPARVTGGPWLDEYYVPRPYF